MSRFCLFKGIVALFLTLFFYFPKFNKGLFFPFSLTFLRLSDRNKGP